MWTTPATTYYDHQLDTISPQGGQLQGGSAVTIYGKRFRTLVDAVGASADSRSIVRCRFGAHEPVAGTIDTTESVIKCFSSNSESYNRQTTGYEFVSVAINGQNFLPSLDGEDGCILNPDACAKFKYYTQTVASIWPPAGPALGTTDVRVSGEFSPGYDGVPTSAQCLYTADGRRRRADLSALEPLVVECEAPLPEATTTRRSTSGWASPSTARTSPTTRPTTSRSARAPPTWWATTSSRSTATPSTRSNPPAAPSAGRR